jgi:two-component system, cell cycle response regulator DivK
MKSTILYIEDNDQNFYLVNFLLSARGHQVAWAKDGPSGIEMAIHTTPALVLLDIQLPTMDGYAVAQALRGNPALVATPIVALTSYAMPGDREKALQAGCTGYIEKPINPSLFAGQIETYLCTVSAGDSTL